MSATCLKCLSATKARRFPDDTNLTAYGDSLSQVEAAANSDLHLANKCNLNVVKTKFMPKNYFQQFPEEEEG
jgi:2-hydroxy-3-keto-5-methylthiopentenyl-1-phosphate phosphatase